MSESVLSMAVWSAPSVSTRADTEAPPGGVRRIVTGIVSPLHQVDTRIGLSIATPVLAVVGSVTLYVVSLGVRMNDDEAASGLLAVTGAAGGALAPMVMAWGRHAYRCLRERRVLIRNPDAAPARLVKHAVDSRFLTLAGLRAQVAKLQEVQEHQPQALASALADLAQAVPVGRSSRCMPEESRPLEQLEFLVDTLQSLGSSLTPQDFNQVILKMSQTWQPDALRDSAYALSVLRVILRPLVTPVARLDPADIRLRATLAVDLRKVPAFRALLQAGGQTAWNILKLTHAAGQEARPRDPMRDGKAVDSKFSSGAGPAHSLFESVAWMSRDTLVCQIVDLCRPGNPKLSPRDLQHISSLLQPAAGDDLRLSAAKCWGRLLVMHWRGDRISMLEHALRSDAAGIANTRHWEQAPCGIREGVFCMARAYPAAPTLQSLAGVVTGLTAVDRQLYAYTELADLRAEVGFAIGIAQAQATASARARYLIGIMDTLASRVRDLKDVPSDMFITGLLSPEDVRWLAAEVVSEQGLTDTGKARLITRLPQLCQYDATADLARDMHRQLRRLQLGRDASEFERFAGCATNTRIVPGGLREAAPDGSLHVLGLEDPVRDLAGQVDLLGLDSLGRDDFKHRDAGSPPLPRVRPPADRLHSVIWA
jgi:hypothetical protein